MLDRPKVPSNIFSIEMWKYRGPGSFVGSKASGSVSRVLKGIQRGWARTSMGAFETLRYSSLLSAHFWSPASFNSGVLILPSHPGG